MFPNVRLMVVAILAAIAGISCGLGLFATFRVNHEPLARLAEGSPPMQLAFDNRVLGSDARAGIEARLPVSGVAKMISIPMVVPTPEPALAKQAGADSPVAVQTASVEQAAPGIEPADRSSTATPAVGVQAEPPSGTPEPAAAVPTQQDVVATAQEQTPATPPAAASGGEQTAAISAAAPDREPALKPTKPAEIKTEDSKAAKPKARASHAVAPARRAIKTVRPRRTVTTVAAQSAYPYSQPTYSQPISSQQPTYTWMDGAAQASQPVKRVQIKRSRIVKPAAPVEQSTPSASTAGLSGTQ
jgi:hypothetical protein